MAHESLSSDQSERSLGALELTSETPAFKKKKQIFGDFNNLANFYNNYNDNNKNNEGNL